MPTYVVHVTIKYNVDLGVTDDKYFFLSMLK